MLLGDFFQIHDLTTADASASASIGINAAHRIFEGHFPGQPVTPGVCMMQIVKELLETITGKKLRLVKADHLKFLALINPNDYPAIQSELSYKTDESGQLLVVARLFADKVTFLKFKGSFLPF